MSDGFSLDPEGIEGAIPNDLYGDEDGEYTVEDSEVEYLEDRR